VALVSVSVVARFFMVVFLSFSALGYSARRFITPVRRKGKSIHAINCRSRRIPGDGNRPRYSGHKSPSADVTGTARISKKVSTNDYQYDYH